jgi:two-component system sensor histidine kinase EvgS
VGAERSPTESVDVRRVVQEVIRSIDPRPGFEVRSSGALPTLETQRVPLERVFQNLLQNALTHHDRDRGLVTVSSELRDGVVHFTVADDGPGIPESDRERIFEMFSRLVAGSGWRTISRAGCASNSPGPPLPLTPPIPRP